MAAEWANRGAASNLTPSRPVVAAVGYEYSGAIPMTHGIVTLPQEMPDNDGTSNRLAKP
jgi:hypothetical protein